MWRHHQSTPDLFAVCASTPTWVATWTARGTVGFLAQSQSVALKSEDPHRSLHARALSSTGVNKENAGSRSDQYRISWTAKSVGIPTRRNTDGLHMTRSMERTFTPSFSGQARKQRTPTTQRCSVTPNATTFHKSAPRKKPWPPTTTSGKTATKKKWRRYRRRWRGSEKKKRGVGCKRSLESITKPQGFVPRSRK